MRDSKPTPGPWSYRSREHDDWGIVRAPTDADGYSPIICQARNPYCLDEEDLAPHRAAKTDPWEANARLIAAAPDMFEALGVAIDAIADMVDGATANHPARIVLAQARAALAKALSLADAGKGVGRG